LRPYGLIVALDIGVICTVATTLAAQRKTGVSRKARRDGRNSLRPYGGFAAERPDAAGSMAPAGKR
jgi:hypothetical protein